MATKARTEHTPGRWYTNGWANEPCQLTIKADEGPVSIYGRGGKPLAIVTGQGPESNAINAALIAAAPDLLAVAQRALDWFDRFGFESMPGSLGSELRNAIAKAAAQ
jgi:hypothetical protein